MLMRSLLLIAMLLAACSSSTAPAAAPTTPAPPVNEPASPASPAATTCEDACTDFGFCFQEVHDGEEGEFDSGCMDDCENADDQDRLDFFDCIADKPCEAMMDCALGA
jgi:hypothetical protein